MCGIAGLADLSGTRPPPSGVLDRMADAIVHRGPDDEGYFECDGVGLANRRLSIVGLADGQQPIANEDGSVVAVFNGELFDYPGSEAAPRSQGPSLRDALRHRADSAPVGGAPGGDVRAAARPVRAGALRSAAPAPRPGARSLRHLPAVLDPATRRRTATGCCSPRRSRRCSPRGMVRAGPDLRGIDQVFHFFAVPGPATCFEGVQTLQPGHYLRIDARPRRRRAPFVSGALLGDRLSRIAGTKQDDGDQRSHGRRVRARAAAARSSGGCAPTCRSSPI